MNILYLYADTEDEWNCSEWRCAVPMRAINEQGKHAARMAAIRDWAMGKKDVDCEWADIIILQRLLMASLIPQIERWKSQGKVIVGEVDDAYNIMPPSVRAYRFWHEGFVRVETSRGVKEVKMAQPPWEQLIWSMKLVHAITTPSMELCGDWRDYNPNVFYLPNYIDGEVYRPHRGKRDPDGRILIGWGGSFSHNDSWARSYLPEALRHIAAKNKDVYIVLAGGNVKVPEMVNIKDRILVTGWMPHSKWPAVLSSFDIGLIPLAGIYDRRRSWLKSLEYTFMGIPWIGSIGPPTRELAMYGTTITNSVKAWERAIESCINHLEERQAEAKKNVDIGEKLTIQQNVNQVIKVYSTIIESVK